MMQRKESSPDDQYAIAYTHLTSIGDRSACLTFIERAKAAISAVYSDGNLDGYQVFMVEDADTAIDEQVTGDALDQVTEGQVPFVYIRLQPTRRTELNLDHFMSNLGCTRID